MDFFGTQDNADNAQFHDRLDKKLGAEHYTDAPCGSLHLGTGQPAYCCAQCPTLRLHILASVRAADPDGDVVVTIA